ncbi:hypothetical protein [Peterkaempfera griseoplana]|uniref:hypothetical protein n=1 Tax=Peterkaempfera griseoplana TaxID=66896 RepID=UPI00099E674D|nr:hypothetical protein [Peterkaempfera griseoplana]
MPVWEESSLSRVVPPARPRKLAKVPFVELAEGRLQGVVSSGSDISRVYVSSVAAGSFGLVCRTNNNRPCGGLRGGLCNHILALTGEAVLQYGGGRVARYLQTDTADADPAAQQITQAIGAGRPQQADDGAAVAGQVFARFLRHLTYLELPATTAPVPEMHWFPAVGAVA